MSAPVSLGAMVSAVTSRSNLENQIVAGGFILPSEVRSYLNEALAELWDLLMAARAQEHMRKSQTITTVQGTSAYSIPSDMEQLISVDWQYATGQFQAIRSYMEVERNMFKFFPASAGWYYGQPVFYRILGSAQMAGSSVALKTINFIPTPQAAYQVTLNYYPNFTPFLTDGSQDSYQFEGVNGWEGFAIWKVVAMCKAKLKEDYSFALGQVQAFLDRIRELADSNDAGQAERIQDVENYDYQWGTW